MGNAKGISGCRTVNWHGQEVRRLAEEVDRDEERRITIEEAARDGVCDKEVCGHLILIRELNARRRPIVMLTEASLY